MYAKVFSSLFDGSMRGQPDLILVFINMLTRCDSDGCVDRTPRAIADETGLPIERVKDAIKMLESPDSESRTPDMEGRRIVLVSGDRTWGWQIVNFRKYRSIRDEQSRRQQNREAQQRYKSKTNKPESSKVSQEKPDKPQSAHTEAEAEAHTEADTETDNRYRAASVPLADASKMLAKKQAVIPEALMSISGFKDAWEGYLESRKSKRQKATEKAKELILAKLATRPNDSVAGLNIAIERSWTGFDWDWVDNADKRKPFSGSSSKNAHTPGFAHPNAVRAQERYCNGELIPVGEDVFEQT